MTDTITARERYSTILHRLIAEMEALTPEQIAAHEPNEAVARSEQVVDELSEALKRMYALRSEKIDRVKALIDQQEALQAAATEEVPFDKAEFECLYNEAKPLQQDIESLDIWRSIREQYAVDPKATGVGLRAGWQVVDMYGTKSNSGLGSLLRGLKDLFGD